MEPVKLFDESPWGENVASGVRQNELFGTASILETQ